MSIRFIQTNYGKLDCDNVLRFLLDLSVVELEDVKPYEQGKPYVKGEFIYLKEDGIHKIFRCKVNMSSDVFVPDEWEHIMDTYDAEIKNVSNFYIKEYTFIIDNDDMIIPEYNPGSSSVIIYKGHEIFIYGKDFTIDETGKIIFADHIQLEPNDRIIVEVRETKGLPDRLILLSSNGLNYEIGIIGEDMFVIETDLIHSKPEIFIKDIVTEENYRLFMLDDELYYELTELYTMQTEIKVLDGDDNEYKLEMVDGELMFSKKE